MRRRQIAAGVNPQNNSPSNATSREGGDSNRVIAFGYDSPARFIYTNSFCRRFRGFNGFRVTVICGFRR
jgi:hypothetical protein